MEEFEKEAVIFAGKEAGCFLDECIKKYDLRTLTEKQWYDFCEVMCKNYHERHIELSIKNAETK